MVCVDIMNYRGHDDVDLVIWQVRLEHVRDTGGALTGEQAVETFVLVLRLEGPLGTGRARGT